MEDRKRKFCFGSPEAGNPESELWLNPLCRPPCERKMEPEKLLQKVAGRLGQALREDLLKRKEILAAPL